MRGTSGNADTPVTMAEDPPPTLRAGMAAYLTRDTKDFFAADVGPYDPYRRVVEPVSMEAVSTTARMGVERLSPTDVMELACDVTGTSMQVAAILVLDTEESLDVAAVREALRRRITAIPRLRQRLMKVPFCGRPVWVDDPSFDISNHVDSVGCTAPGDLQALMNVAAETVTRPLPPGRPLWSATLVTGLAEDRNALVVVFHHVLADGIGGLAVLGCLVDGTLVDGDADFPRRPPRPRDLLIDLLGSAGRTLARAAGGDGPAAGRRHRIGRRQKPARAALHAEPVDRHRPGTRGRDADLGAVHAAAHAAGGTVNDVVLTAVTGALRTVLARTGRGRAPVGDLHAGVRTPPSRRHRAG